MKIYIIYKFQDGPWGGGNQFLKALKRQWEMKGVYSESVEEADVILFNSHHNLRQVLELKRKYPKKIFIHRVDGPIDKYRENNEKTDPKIYRYNNIVADGTVFQSKWSQEENHKSGMKKNAFETVIINAPDPNIFNPNGKIPFAKDGKTKLIATSWSANWNKGFDVYQFLDENLDFSRYEMTFIGRSPVEFKNIRLIDPLPSDQLASELKQHDIFITASKFDPCSNSLLEALACGLPALVRNSGGHPEIIERGGLVFDGTDDVLKKLDALSSDIQNYQNRIPQRNISEVADQYYSFASGIFEQVGQNQYIPKKLGLIKTLLIKL